MTARPQPRGIREASKALDGALGAGEIVVAAIEGQRTGPGKVWLGSLGLGALLVQLSPIQDVFPKIMALVVVAIGAYAIGYSVGHYAPTAERKGFGFILALTDRGLYIVSQPLLGPPTDIEGPIPASTIEVSTRRKILSYLVSLTGGAELRLRVAAGSQLNEFLDELNSNRG